MTQSNGGSAAERSVSLPGALAVASGCGLLLGYVKFGAALPVWNPLTRTVFFVAIVFLEVWGIGQLARGGGARTAKEGGRRKRRPRIMLPVPGMAYIAIMVVMFLGHVLGQSPLLMLVFAMMAGPFVLNGWVMLSMLKRTRVERRAPPFAMAGEAIAVELTVVNDKRWLASWSMEVWDRVVRDGEETRAGVLFARVPPRSRRSEIYRLKLMRRGRYTFGPLELTTRFPMGLVERGVWFDEPAETIVYPRLGRLTSRWRRERLRAAELTRRPQPHRGAFDDEFHHLREHRWGDNPRSIHWRTSARQGELMVREFHESREPDLVLLLDLWLPRRPSDEDLDRVELAVSFAATVCVEQLRRSYDAVLEVRIAGREFSRWSGRQGTAAVESMLKTLALSEAAAAADVGRLIDEATAIRAQAVRTLLVTTRPPGDDAHAPVRDAIEKRGGRGSPPRVIVAAAESLDGLFRWE
ncbi:MAG: DUF58 domain-containing protein [Planctomycetales bacterium]